MLQQMVEIQNSVSELLEIPRDFNSVQESVTGLTMEVSDLGEAIEDARLEPKVLETLNLNKADCSAVAALAYLLEYFVLRDWDAYDIEAAYLMLMGEVIKKQEAEVETDAAFFDMLKSVLAGDLPEFIESFCKMEAEIEEINSMNGVNDLILKQAYTEMQIKETVKIEVQDFEAMEEGARIEMEKERLDKVMQEAIGPDFGQGPGM